MWFLFVVRMSGKCGWIRYLRKLIFKLSWIFNNLENGLKSLRCWGVGLSRIYLMKALWFWQKQLGGEISNVLYQMRNLTTDNNCETMREEIYVIINFFCIGFFKSSYFLIEFNANLGFQSRSLKKTSINIFSKSQTSQLFFVCYYFSLLIEGIIKKPKRKK